jgi:protein TonB
LPSNDFFKWTLVSSVVFHLFVVLGISFVMPASRDQAVIGPPLKITLVSSASELTPEEAETLAQFNSIGEEDAGSGLPTIIRESVAVETSEAAQQDEILNTSSNTAELQSYSNSATETPPQTTLSRQQLADSINLAYLNAQSRPREAYATANSRQSKYAAYIEKWRLLVERVGNLNYPEAAKQQRLEGSLVLDVSINADGQIGRVRILKTSDIKILDDAAERIVHIAAPFDRFPESFSSEIDTLHIVRTWEFGQDKVVSRNLEFE